MPLPAPDVSRVRVDMQVTRIVSMMKKVSLSRATSMLTDVMSGYEKKQWTNNQILAIMEYYNERISIVTSERP